MKRNDWLYWHYSKPFEEMVLSWQGTRPLQIEVQIHNGVWSPWVEYALWERDFQRGGGKNEVVNVDCVRAADRAKIRARGNIKRLFLNVRSEQLDEGIGHGCQIEVGQVWSQMELDHERRGALCSPTSVCNALSILGVDVEPLDMAKKVYDSANNIYGNWAFAASAAGEYVGGVQARWLGGLSALERELVSGKPVVVSVQGGLENAPKEYSEGHLMVVVGFSENFVSVLDSAFDTESQVCVRYLIVDFEKAWRNRNFLAYTF